MTSTALKPTYIFNQYYIDLLKKIKNISKKHKTQSETAKRVLKSVKDNYQTYDKTSDEYLEFFKNSCNNDFWSSYIELEEDKYSEWLKEDKNVSIEIYKNITIKDVAKLLRNNYMVHHYLTVLYIYTNEMTEEEITKILKILQEKKEVNLDEDEYKIDNENINKILKRFLKEKSKQEEEEVKNEDDDNIPGMDSLKDTTIGKIAKEIIEDIDLTKIKQSINEEGDIFKAIAKPDSGFGELFTNVSQKMSNKISTGELSQEAIFKDAMKFASLLPGMLGTNGAGGGASSGGKSANSGFDMEAMMNMMNMMSNMNGGGGGGGGKKTKTGVNSQALKNIMKKQQLRHKLNNK